MLLLPACVLVLALLFCLPALADPQPNLVLILADDLGYGDLSSYGAPDLRTPHIDSLAEGGVRFDSFYANCPVCSPTRASIMTGRYPEYVGVPGVIRTHPDDSWGRLVDDAVLLPQVLKAAGYKTALVGKWHLGLQSPDTPNERGFDHFHGFLGDMMDDYLNHRRHGINYMRLNGDEIDPEGHATDLFTQWAVDYIRARVGSDRPFFLYLCYNAPHTPIQPPEEWVEKVKEREPGIDETRARLVALIEHMDDGVGKVLAALKESGQRENTLVLFTSDNGGQLDVGARNGPLRAGKGTVYEGGLKVPMCAAWPGNIPAGSRRDEMAMTMDLFPTFCEAAGVKIDHPIEGVSLLPTMLGAEPAPVERDLFFSRREGGNAFMGKTIDCVRRGDWKLVQNSPFRSMELYNLQSDPLEEENLAQTETEVFESLAAALRAHIQRRGAVPWQKGQG